MDGGSTITALHGRGPEEKGDTTGQLGMRAGTQSFGSMGEYHYRPSEEVLSDIVQCSEILISWYVGYVRWSTLPLAEDNDVSATRLSCPHSLVQTDLARWGRREVYTILG